MDKKEYRGILENFNCSPCNECMKFSPEGEAFFADNQYYTGNYWYYMDQGFIIDIHDFYFKKEYVTSAEYNEQGINMFEYAYIISNYLVVANGESLNPYENIGSDMMMVIIDDRKLNHSQRFSFHANSRYIAVGIKYNKSYIEDNFKGEIKISTEDLGEMFLDTRSILNRPISKIASEILNCKMEGLSAKMFFEAKAKEWLSLTVNAYNELKGGKKELPKSDVEAIKNVAEYIDDHYSLDISQEFLEKISMMSGTKLKSNFKKYFNQTITEYTQRKRMNIAENLLVSTDLKIADIAKAVGYNSPSRFSTIFRRYKGIYPKDIRARILKLENKE